MDRSGVGTPAHGQSTQGVSGRPELIPIFDRTGRAKPGPCTGEGGRPGTGAPKLRGNLHVDQCGPPKATRSASSPGTPASETELIQVCADLSDPAIGSKATDAVGGGRADSSRQQGHRQPGNQKESSCFRGKAVTSLPLRVGVDTRNMRSATKADLPSANPDLPPLVPPTIHLPIVRQAHRCDAEM